MPRGGTAAMGANVGICAQGGNCSEEERAIATGTGQKLRSGIGGENIKARAEENLVLRES